MYDAFERGEEKKRFFVLPSGGGVRQEIGYAIFICRRVIAAFALFYGHGLRGIGNDAEILLWIVRFFCPHWAFPYFFGKLNSTAATTARKERPPPCLSLPLSPPPQIYVPPPYLSFCFLRDPPSLFLIMALLLARGWLGGFTGLGTKSLLPQKRSEQWDRFRKRTFSVEFY